MNYRNIKVIFQQLSLGKLYLSSTGGQTQTWNASCTDWADICMYHQMAVYITEWSLCYKYRSWIHSGYRYSLVDVCFPSWFLKGSECLWTYDTISHPVCVSLCMDCNGILALICYFTPSKQLISWLCYSEQQNKATILGCCCYACQASHSSTTHCSLQWKWCYIYHFKFRIHS